MVGSYQGKWPKIGKNVYIAPTATVIGDVTLGDHSSVWPSAVVRGDMAPIVIGEYTNVQDGAVIHVSNGGPTNIGNYVTIGHLAHVHAATIEDEVLVGSTSVVLDGALVKSHAMIGAQSLVTPRSVIEQRSLMMGSPAKLKKELNDEAISGIKKNALEYVRLKDMYIKEEQND